MKLKPCPFCGEKPVALRDYDEYRIFCGNPDCPVSVVITDDDAFRESAWNTRAYENEISTLESRLKHLLQSDAVRLYDEFDPTISGGYKRDISELDRLVFDSKREEKTAHWDINVDGYYPFCSHCGEEPPGREMTAYCPNCGAKMVTRGRDDDPA